MRCPLTGDVDGDGDVDAQDVHLTAAAWHGHPVDLDYDVDGDGDVDIVDVMRVAKEWGYRCSRSPTALEAGGEDGDTVSLIIDLQDQGFRVLHVTDGQT